MNIKDIGIFKRFKSLLQCIQYNRQKIYFRFSAIDLYDVIIFDVVISFKLTINL